MYFIKILQKKHWAPEYFYSFEDNVVYTSMVSSSDQQWVGENEPYTFSSLKEVLFCRSFLLDHYKRKHPHAHEIEITIVSKFDPCITSE